MRRAEEVLEEAYNLASSENDDQRKILSVRFICMLLGDVVDGKYKEADKLLSLADVNRLSPGTLSDLVARAFRHTAPGALPSYYLFYDRVFARKDFAEGSSRAIYTHARMLERIHMEGTLLDASWKVLWDTYRHQAEGNTLLAMDTLGNYLGDLVEKGEFEEASAVLTGLNLDRLATCQMTGALMMAFHAAPSIPGYLPFLDRVLEFPTFRDDPERQENLRRRFDTRQGADHARARDAYRKLLSLEIQKASEEIELSNLDLGCSRDMTNLNMTATATLKLLVNEEGKTNTPKQLAVQSLSYVATMQERQLRIIEEPVEIGGVVTVKYQYTHDLAKGRLGYVAKFSSEGVVSREDCPDGRAVDTESLASDHYWRSTMNRML